MKTSKDLLSSILKTAQMGQVGIRAVLRTDLNSDLRTVLNNQLTQYSIIEAEAHQLAIKQNWKPQELSPMSKIMATSTTKTRLAYGNTSSKTAAMMIQGNTRGIIKSLKNLNHYDHSDPRIEMLAQKLLKCEEDNAQQMQRFV